MEILLNSRIFYFFMELLFDSIITMIHLITAHLKPALMNLSKILWHLLIIAVFTALSCILAHSIAVGNLLGVVLAAMSLVATIVFLWLLPKLYEQPEKESETV